MKIYHYLIIIPLFLLIGLGGFIACKTFTPIWIDQLPPVCNMALNNMKLHYSSGDKSGTVPSTTACNKKLNRLDCREQIYGHDGEGTPNKVDREDFTLFKEYASCLSELN